MVFFRSPSTESWNKAEPQLRGYLEAYCVSENRRLIQTMRPKQILLLGWDALELMGGGAFREIVAVGSSIARKRRKRLLRAGTIEGTQAYAIPHPTASWKHPPVTDEDWAMISEGVKAGV